MELGPEDVPLLERCPHLKGLGTVCIIMSALFSLSLCLVACLP